MDGINFDKKTIIYLVSFFVLFVVFSISIFFSYKIDNKLDTRVLKGEVIRVNSDLITIRDEKGNEYKLNSKINVLEGD